MPEGDTIHYAARRIRPVLEGQVPDEIATPHPRFGRDRWPARLAGQAVRSVDAHGKHLFLRFDGGLVIHSHLRMTGSWKVRKTGRPAPGSAWLVIRRGDREVVQLRGPVLELMTESRTRFDQRLAGLGPDILAPELDEGAFLHRLRHDDPTRPIGDALLDQRTIAGIGNLWKSEGCFAAAIDPWRPAGRVGDDEVLAIVRELRPRMQQSAQDGRQDRWRRIYNAAGRPRPHGGGPRVVPQDGGPGRTPTHPWVYRIGILALPLPFAANAMGWIFTEMGRQPWSVFGVLSTADSDSPTVSAGLVATSLGVYAAIYAVLAVVEVRLIVKYVRAGLPEIAPEPPHDDEAERPLAFAY